MSSLPKRKPTYVVLEDGYIVPRGFDPVRFRDSQTLEPEAGDVFICTYPKCGTTWTQCILRLLLTGGRPLGEGEHICSVIPHLEDDGKEVVMALPKPRIIKTHLPYNMVPKSDVAKYIFVARNPKDCCVSFFYHTKGFASHYQWADGRFEDYFDLFLSGQVDSGDYFDYLLSFLPRMDDPNFLFLLYEEMKSDTRAAIWKIGRFLGGPFLESCEDPAVLEEVLRLSGFQSMKSTPSNWSTPQVEGSAGFIRKGEVGDWRRHFTEEQTRLMDEKFAAKLSGTKAEHFWDKYDC